MGNRSIFTVLADKQKNLPSFSDFTADIDDKEDEQTCTFNLKDFVNSGADKDTPVFMVAIREGGMSLVELIKNIGYENDLKKDYLVEKTTRDIKI